MDYSLLKEKLIEKINAKNIEKETKDKCEHEFKKYKQTIRIDNDNFKGSAWFEVIACSKCKTKKIIDYKVL